jgi:hypothetical protein
MTTTTIIVTGFIIIPILAYIAGMAYEQGKTQQACERAYMRGHAVGYAKAEDDSTTPRHRWQMND